MHWSSVSTVATSGNHQAACGKKRHYVPNKTPETCRRGRRKEHQAIKTWPLGPTKRMTVHQGVYRNVKLSFPSRRQTGRFRKPRYDNHVLQARWRRLEVHDRRQRLPRGGSSRAGHPAGAVALRRFGARAGPVAYQASRSMICSVGTFN